MPCLACYASPWKLSIVTVILRARDNVVRMSRAGCERTSSGGQLMTVFLLMGKVDIVSVVPFGR